MKDEPITFDSILNLCQNQHRRIVLTRLAEEQQSLPLTDLMEAIFNDKHQMPVADAPEAVLREIRLSLNQVDLPNLASEGLIHYDREHEAVEPTEQFSQVQPTLSTILAAETTLKVPMKQ